MLNQIHFTRCKQVDNGGTEFKATHFLAFKQCHRTVVFPGRPGPALDDTFARRRNGARPDRLNAANNRRSDQNLRHWAKFGIEKANHAFVTGKQIRHVLSGEMVNGEEIARHVDHLTQNTVARHVYAVVVTRGEVSGHKRTVAEQVRHQIVACQQGFEAVVVAFGLQDFIFFDFTQLADNAIGRHDQDIRIGIDWAYFVTQRTDKEFVKGAVAGGVRLLRLFHVDLVVFNEQIDNQFCQPSCPLACAPTRQASKP